MDNSRYQSLLNGLGFVFLAIIFFGMFAGCMRQTTCPFEYNRNGGVVCIGTDPETGQSW